MGNNQFLTSETLTKKFKSNFDLVNYAIALAESKIKRGHISHAIERDNIVISVLKDIEDGRDCLEPIIAIAEHLEPVKFERGLLSGSYE